MWTFYSTNGTMSCFRLLFVLFISLPLSVFAAPLPAPGLPSTSDIEHTASWATHAVNGNVCLFSPAYCQVLRCPVPKDTSSAAFNP